MQTPVQFLPHRGQTGFGNFFLMPAPAITFRRIQRR